MGNITFHPIIPIWLMAIICVILIAIKRKGIAPYIRQIIMVLILFAINLRPMYISSEVKVMRQKLNCYCVIVVDDTLSMMAEDYEGGDDDKVTRMDAAKADIDYITKKMAGAKFCIIDFNNDVNLLTPFTDDPAYVRSVVDAMKPLVDYHATGTNINVCKPLLATMLNDAKMLNDGHVVVFFLSDGENTDKNKLDSFADISEGIEGGAVLGYGTTKGGQMHYYDELHDETVLVEDKRSYPYKPAVSKIDEKNLKQIANDLNIDYIHMEKSEDLDDTIENVMKLLNKQQEESTEYGYADVYFWFVIPLAALLAYEFISVKRRT
jgi:Ca-activated chloride channel family protein